MADDKKNKDTNLGQEGNQNWDDANDQKNPGSREPNPERFEDANLGQGQQSNQNWDDENDKRSDKTHKPNPERSSGGSAFNERQQTSGGYGSSQKEDKPNVGPLDSDFDDLPSEKRFGNNQTGPGLG